MKNKKPVYMFKVTCGNCGRMRLWDNYKDFDPDTCPKCSSGSIKFKKVGVTE